MSSPQRPKFPTDEQRAVLDSTARITVVRACPGAGKTEVFVEAIRRKLRGWDTHGSGLAALSFTNIARDTIDNRVGETVGSPHFVGTLDSFVFRFIVRPFGHLVGLPQGGVRLFPANLCKTLETPEAAVGNDGKLRCPIYNIHFCGIQPGSPKLPLLDAEVPVKGFKTRRFAVESQLTQKVWDIKKSLWKNTGIITHSDCHFLASSILHHKVHGGRIRDIIARRFPVLFIDEVQDTGFFLARTFLSLFSDEKISGLLVGDPDQAIYGFGGASPTIFDDFEKLPGAIPLPLTLSQRCPVNVAKVASALSASGQGVKPLPDAIQGCVSLVVHDLAAVKLTPQQVKIFKGLLDGKSLAVISRKSSTAELLRGHAIRNEFQGKSKAARRINFALQHLVNGDPREAFRIVEMEIEQLVDKTDEEEIDGSSEITPSAWRSAIFGVLSNAAKRIAGETWNEWVGRIRTAVKVSAESLGWKDDGKSLKGYMACNKTGDEMRFQLLDTANALEWDSQDTITTIHKVKGAEFDTVILFVPKPSKGKCPSVQWWSSEGGSEEQRIAFVATSRAKRRFVLCLHKSVFEAMKKSRPEFLKYFDAPIALA